MKIFIDESGVFLPVDKVNSWSSVGALTVPESSMAGLSNALRDLKKALGVDCESEIKKPRPDSNKSCFINFLKKVKNLNCTLHMASTNGGLLKEKEITEHRKGNVQGLNNFKEQQRSELVPEEFNKLARHVESTISNFESIPQQEYVQCVMQSYLLSLMIEKVIYFYSFKNPESLSSFSWVIDQKSEKKNKFEITYQNVMPGLVEANSVKRSKVLPNSSKNNYHYFGEAFSSANNTVDDSTVEYYKRTHNKDISSFRDSLAVVDYFKIFNSDMQFSDSKGNVGLEVADLLVSSVNRCLKGNFSDNIKMAKILGSLLLNSPRINEKAISMMVLTNNPEPFEFDEEIINLLDANSFKLYNENFRRNCFKNLSKYE